MVSATTIICILFSMFFSVALPLVMAIVIKKKFNTSLKPFLAGCLIWFVFAMVLEQIMHSIVLGSGVGNFIQNNIWLYGLYGGLAAGIFEEVGRFVAIKFMLKNTYSNKYNAVMYGAGHGGFEAFFLLGTAMLNNLIYSICVNTGTLDLLTAPLTGEQKEAFEQVINSLIVSKPYVFLVGDFERISAVILHIGLSLLVWSAVVYGKKIMFFLAIFFHFLVDALTVIINGYIGNVFILEGIIFVMAAVITFLSVCIWKKAADENLTV